MDQNRINFIYYKGKRILHLDFSHCKALEIVEIIEKAKPIIAENKENSLITLTDVSNASFDRKVMAAMKEFTAHNKKYVKIGAVVGVKGMLKVAYEFVAKFSGRNFILADTIEEAKDRLVDSAI